MILQPQLPECWGCARTWRPYALRDICTISGRVGVSSAIWDKAGPLSTAERDQARLHAYHSERILARIPPLAELAKLAGQHHEHCDGSGYHRGFTRSPAVDAVSRPGLCRQPTDD